MKTVRWCFFLLALFCFNALFAQEELGSGLLLPRFEQGIVNFKNGTRSTALFNYNMITQQMVFLEADSTVMAIANPLNVLVVTIGDRKFVPISSQGDFYEEIPAGNGVFFVKRRAILLSQGKAAGYGGYSQTSSVTSYGSWNDNMGSYTKLKPDEKFRLKTECTYYLLSGKTYKRFFSSKTLGKLFKGHESEIEKFANEHAIDFSKVEDVVRIVEYGFGLNS